MVFDGRARLGGQSTGPANEGPLLDWAVEAHSMQCFRPIRRSELERITAEELRQYVTGRATDEQSGYDLLSGYYSPCAVF